MRLMRIFRIKALSLLGMVLLMAATASPALARMTCVMSGQTVLSWGQVDDCSTDTESPEATISATCCQFGLAQPPHADFTAAAAMALPALPVAVMPWPVLVPAPLQADGKDLRSLRGPPSAPGSQGLAVTGVFRI